MQTPSSNSNNNNSNNATSINNCSPIVKTIGQWHNKTVLDIVIRKPGRLGIDVVNDKENNSVSVYKVNAEESPFQEKDVFVKAAATTTTTTTTNNGYTHLTHQQVVELATSDTRPLSFKVLRSSTYNTTSPSAISVTPVSNVGKSNTSDNTNNNVTVTSNDPFLHTLQSSKQWILGESNIGTEADLASIMGAAATSNSNNNHIDTNTNACSPTATINNANNDTNNNSHTATMEDNVEDNNVKDNDIEDNNVEDNNDENNNTTTTTNTTKPAKRKYTKRDSNEPKTAKKQKSTPPSKQKAMPRPTKSISPYTKKVGEAKGDNKVRVQIEKAKALDSLKTEFWDTFKVTESIQDLTATCKEIYAQAEKEREEVSAAEGKLMSKKSPPPKALQPKTNEVVDESIKQAVADCQEQFGIGSLAMSNNDDDNSNNRILTKHVANESTAVANRNNTKAQNIAKAIAACQEAFLDHESATTNSSKSYVHDVMIPVNVNNPAAIAIAAVTRTPLGQTTKITGTTASTALLPPESKATLETPTESDKSKSDQADTDEKGNAGSSSTAKAKNGSDHRKDTRVSYTMLQKQVAIKYMKHPSFKNPAEAIVSFKATVEDVPLTTLRKWLSIAHELMQCNRAADLKKKATGRTGRKSTITTESDIIMFIKDCHREVKAMTVARVIDFLQLYHPEYVAKFHENYKDPEKSLMQQVRRVCYKHNLRPLRSATVFIPPLEGATVDTENDNADDDDGNNNDNKKGNYDRLSLQPDMQEILCKYPRDRMYNIDQTGIWFDFGTSDVFDPKLPMAISGNKRQFSGRISAILGLSATGVKLPILFIIEGDKKGRIALRERSTYPQNHYYIFQRSVCIDDTSWQKYINMVIAPHVPKQSAIIIDALDCQTQRSNVEMCKINANSTIVPLPPNCPAVFQPLDSGILQQFKADFDALWNLAERPKMTVGEKRKLALDLTVQAFNELSTATIQAAWNEFLPETHSV